jgi:hypothetical protein
MNPPPCRDCPQADKCSREKLACGVFRTYVSSCTYHKTRQRTPTHEAYVKVLTRDGIEAEESTQNHRHQRTPRRAHAKTNQNQDRSHVQC